MEYTGWQVLTWTFIDYPASVFIALFAVLVSLSYYFSLFFFTLY